MLEAEAAFSASSYETYDLDLVLRSDHGRLVPIALDDNKIVFDRDGPVIDVELSEQGTDRSRADDLVRLAVHAYLQSLTPNDVAKTKQERRRLGELVLKTHRSANDSTSALQTKSSLISYPPVARGSAMPISCNTSCSTRSPSVTRWSGSRTAGAGSAAARTRTRR